MQKILLFEILCEINKMPKDIGLDIIIVVCNYIYVRYRVKFIEMENRVVGWDGGREESSGRV